MRREGRENRERRAHAASRFEMCQATLDCLCRKSQVVWLGPSQGGGRDLKYNTFQSPTVLTEKAYLDHTILSCTNPSGIAVVYVQHLRDIARRETHHFGSVPVAIVVEESTARLQ